MGLENYGHCKENKSKILDENTFDNAEYIALKSSLGPDSEIFYRFFQKSLSRGNYLLAEEVLSENSKVIDFVTKKEWKNLYTLGKMFDEKIWEELNGIEKKLETSKKLK